jgi:hypothetical protein
VPVQFGVGPNCFVLAAGLEWLGENVVAVVVVDNHDVFVSIARGDGETARLIAKTFAGDFHSLLEDPIDLFWSNQMACWVC